MWTDSDILYFHFNTTNGGFASLPMKRVIKKFSYPFVGVPGTFISREFADGAPAQWAVPGYKCLNCAATFFAASKDGLKHGCMNNGGIVHDKA